eukprot:GCRY01001790.1.p1 GENE.GCRY01001790.1~~GCRY01001790.1.p1  ORF type:complete len:441 (+),score=48.71 GCRY01001790.1:177-1325(+)
MSNETPLIRLGVCCMKKKSQSSPMKQLLIELNSPTSVFDIIVFPEELILERPIEDWPVVDALIAIDSEGFPLSKALKYIQMQKNMFCVNSLEASKLFSDRRMMMSVLQENKILAPKSFYSSDGEIIEKGDILQCGENILHRPFVEKPVNAEDHAVRIYYPKRMGGGVRECFRKTKSLSSSYLPEINSIRKNMECLYQEFLDDSEESTDLSPSTDRIEESDDYDSSGDSKGLCSFESNFKSPGPLLDIKVYAVGKDYALAQTRKAPILDGIVERDEKGREKRSTIPLTEKEKEICGKVTQAFRHFVCGFDIIRCKGHSYVIDVNGWSFVKNCPEYTRKAAVQIRNHILAHVSPHQSSSPPPPPTNTHPDPSIAPTPDTGAIQT